MQVVVDSLMTQYQRQGKQSNVALVLHGWGDSSAGLLTLCQSLAATHDVIVLDLPGFGGTAVPIGVWGLDEYTQFIHHFLQKVGVSHVSLLIGHSNGGALAIRGLATGTLQADKLVLLASAGIRTTQKGRKRMIMLLTKAGKVLTLPLPGAVKTKLRSKLYASVGSDMLVAEHLQETFKRVVGQDVQADAATLDVPTLLVYGEDDQSTPVAYGRIFESLISGSTLEVLPGAGHFIHLDRPADVLHAIQDFA